MSPFRDRDPLNAAAVTPSRTVWALQPREGDSSQKVAEKMGRGSGQDRRSRRGREARQVQAHCGGFAVQAHGCRHGRRSGRPPSLSCPGNVLLLAIHVAFQLSNPHASSTQPAQRSANSLKVLQAGGPTRSAPAEQLTTSIPKNQRPLQSASAPIGHPCKGSCVQWLHPLLRLRRRQPLGAALGGCGRCGRTPAFCRCCRAHRLLCYRGGLGLLLLLVRRRLEQPRLALVHLPAQAGLHRICLPWAPGDAGHLCAVQPCAGPGGRLPLTGPAGK